MFIYDESKEIIYFNLRSFVKYLNGKHCKTVFKIIVLIYYGYLLGIAVLGNYSKKYGTFKL